METNFLMDVLTNNPIAGLILIALYIGLPFLSQWQVSKGRKQAVSETQKVHEMTKKQIEQDVTIRKQKRDAELRDQRDDYTAKIQNLEHLAMKSINDLKLGQVNITTQLDAHRDIMSRHLSAHDALNDKFFNKLDALVDGIHSMDIRLTKIESQLAVMQR